MKIFKWFSLYYKHFIILISIFTYLHIFHFKCYAVKLRLFYKLLKNYKNINIINDNKFKIILRKN